MLFVRRFRAVARIGVLGKAIREELDLLLAKKVGALEQEVNC